MLSKKVAILQSSYIPWKGYFDLMNMVDEFVLYDNMQYTKRDWRNRNLIKTPKGCQWLSIPVEVSGNYYQKIKDTKVADKSWGKAHWGAIKCNYAKAPFFNHYKDLFEELYLNSSEEYLSEINYKFLTQINKILGISTKISWSSNYELVDGKTERLIGLCLSTGATEYISGPAAKDYIEEELFLEASLKLSWMDYSGYDEYNQLHPPFIHGVSILDLIFNTGSDATKFMKSAK